MTETRALGQRQAAVARPRPWARLVPGIVAVGFAAVLLTACPQTAHASPIVFENRTPSTAWIVDGAVGGAQRVAVPHGPFRIYGTLRPGEAVDAFEFVVPSATTATAVLHVKDAADTEETRLTLTVASADGKPLVEGTPQSRVGSRFDWRSLERLRVESSAVADLAAGQTYILAVGPGTVTDVTVPYSVVVTTGNDSAAPLRINYQTISDIGRLWLGSYAQQSLRGPRLVAVILVALILLVLASNVVAALIQRVKRGTEPRAGEFGHRPTGGLRPEPALAGPRAPFMESPQRRSDSASPLWVAPPAPVIARDTGGAARPSFAAAAWPQTAQPAQSAPPSTWEWGPEHEPQPTTESPGVQATPVMEHASELPRVLDAETMRSWESGSEESPATGSVQVVEPETDASIDLEWDLAAELVPESESAIEPALESAQEVSDAVVADPAASHAVAPDTGRTAVPEMTPAPPAPEDSEPLIRPEPVSESEIEPELLWGWEPAPVIVVDQEAEAGPQLESELHAEVEAEVSMTSELEALIAAAAAQAESAAESQPIMADEHELAPTASEDFEAQMARALGAGAGPESQPASFVEPGLEWVSEAEPSVVEGYELAVAEEHEPLVAEGLEPSVVREPAVEWELNLAAPSDLLAPVTEPESGPEPGPAFDSEVGTESTPAPGIATGDAAELQPEVRTGRESESQTNTWFTLLHRRRRVPGPAPVAASEDGSELMAPEEPTRVDEFPAEPAREPEPEVLLSVAGEVVLESEVGLVPEPELRAAPEQEFESTTELEPVVETVPTIEAEAPTVAAEIPHKPEYAQEPELAQEPESRSKRRRKRKRAHEPIPEAAMEAGTEPEVESGITPALETVAEVPVGPQPDADARFQLHAEPETEVIREESQPLLEAEPEELSEAESASDSQEEAESDLLLEAQSEEATEPESVPLLEPEPEPVPETELALEAQSIQESPVEEEPPAEPEPAVEVAYEIGADLTASLESVPEEAVEPLAEREPAPADKTGSQRKRKRSREVAPEAQAVTESEPTPVVEPGPQTAPETEPISAGDSFREPAVDQEPVVEAESLSDAEPEESTAVRTAAWEPAYEPEPLVIPEPMAEPRPAVAESAPLAAAVSMTETVEHSGRARVAAKTTRKQRASAIPRRTARDLFGQFVDEARYRLNIGSDSLGDDPSFSYDKRIEPYAGGCDEAPDRASTEASE